MATDLSHLSLLAQFQNLSQQQKLSWNWTKGHRPEERNNSWELRAFEDNQPTRSTWLPRAYTCTFCRREFKSAQALGGHMNVHRRDRARLRQSSQEDEPTPTTTDINASHTVMFPCEDRSPIVYPMDAGTSSSSFGLGSRELDLLREHVIRENKHDESSDVMVVEEVDLELRLGW